VCEKPIGDQPVEQVETKGKRRRNVYVDSITLQMLKQHLGGRITGRLFQGNGRPVRHQQLNTALD
jgi:hypothetical protein